MTKACGCGRHYDSATWSELELVAEDWLGVTLRNCECGSTLAVEKEQEEDDG